MLHKTATTIGALRLGDRFYFVSDSKKIAYQVTSDKKQPKTSYNIINSYDFALWPFDKVAANEKPVIFLRHTIPLPGDECQLFDLQEGDIFFFTEDVVTEYVILDTQGSDPLNKYLVHAQNVADKTFLQGDTTVFYVGKAELQK